MKPDIRYLNQWEPPQITGRPLPTLGNERVEAGLPHSQQDLGQMLVENGMDLCTDKKLMAHSNAP